MIAAQRASEGISRCRAAICSRGSSMGPRWGAPPRPGPAGDGCAPSLAARCRDGLVAQGRPPRAATRRGQKAAQRPQGQLRERAHVRRGAGDAAPVRGREEVWRRKMLCASVRWGRARDHRGSGQKPLTHTSFTNSSGLRGPSRMPMRPPNPRFSARRGGGCNCDPHRELRP